MCSLLIVLATWRDSASWSGLGGKLDWWDLEPIEKPRGPWKKIFSSPIFPLYSSFFFFFYFGCILRCPISVFQIKWDAFGGGDWIEKKTCQKKKMNLQKKKKKKKNVSARKWRHLIGRFSRILPFFLIPPPFLGLFSASFLRAFCAESASKLLERIQLTYYYFFLLFQ